LLKAPKKGFGIPLLDWFKTSEFSDRIESLKKSDFGLNNQAITKLISENAKGIKNNGNIIWMLFLYDAWINKKSKIHS
jgi:asparagine synthase (glutamine-hydrolysing)